MSQPTNTALYMDDDCRLSVKREFPILTPENDEVLVKVLFSGVNPADVKHGQQLGIRPVVLGYDFSGHIVSAPPGSTFKAGDAVAGTTPTGLGRPARFGTHQDYVACPADRVFHVPQNLPMPDAACLAVVASTAADVIFNLFGLPALPAAAPPPDGTLLVWGGSTAVGSSVVQYARASGVRTIIATASASRHEMLRGLGATHCFDYRDGDVEAQIATLVRERGLDPIRYALDAAGSPGESGGGPSSAERMSRCAAPDAVRVSVVFGDPRVAMAFADRSRDVSLRVEGAPHPITIPRDEAKAARVKEALGWAVRNYGDGFVLPCVDAWSGKSENALQQIRLVADWGKFGKVAIQHPLL
ncbi:hypothetical protein MGG_16924 [Pyricularia oryzae 70-15]|uniref:Enoyl reductase (ER) domain-containing protein n=1 Tax=Pyricularia oryzae (strain 70-15 / ATCC MYA-4617 / FGSC 8958) TaxID=242507 RepID=G4N100_PYRO7|nr:uncharacterized protein MGG_16924 [Pyricularia oryzae 70-15]EHA53176.1 hypothetical protein MGG_16924 [Pyricularia oryzae 70-15]